MRGATRGALLPLAFALILLFASGFVGYVYSHEPARDELAVRFEGIPPPGPTYLVGSVASVGDGVLTLALRAGGEREVALPASVSVEDLQRLDGALQTGARVNVGVDDTPFGLVLTGLVTFEGRP